jgi:hypothetical protein
MKENLCTLAAMFLFGLSTVSNCAAGEGLSAEIDVTWKTKQKDGGYKVKFSGATNLPAESSLRVTLSSRDSVSGPGGSSECKVRPDGTFSTGYYGPFFAGDYEVRVFFEPRSQSPEVQAVTGPKGEFLKGDLVEARNVKNFSWNTASKISRVQLGNAAEASQAADEKAAKTKDIAMRILTLRELMAEIYGRKDDLQWIPFSREFIKQWNEIGEELKLIGSVNLYAETIASHVALYEMFEACKGSDPAKVDAADANFRAVAKPLKALVEAEGLEKDARPRDSAPAGKAK